MLNQFLGRTIQDDSEKQLHEVTTIEQYRSLVQVYSNILEVVFSNKYVAPHPYLSLTFVKLIKELSILQKSPLFNCLPPFNFDDYNNLTVNIEWMKSNYPNKKKSLLEYRAKIENLFIDVCKIEGNLPDYMEQDLKYYEGLIKEHKALVMTQKPVVQTSLEFTARTSHKKSVFVILETNINEWVDKKEIMKKIGIKYDDFRSIVSQLRKSILNQGLDGNFIIENNKKGCYKLTRIK